MGIPRLTSFFNKNFHNWHPVTWTNWDGVIIDGNNICYALYNENHSWVDGGEYKEFSQTVAEFFKQDDFKHIKKIIVVFDGFDLDTSKEETQRQRRVESMEAMFEVQNGAPSGRKFGAPLHIVGTFMEVIREMDIEFYVAEGDADKVIASLANHHKCPVLSSDSDFFIFDLKCGFVHFNRHLKGKNSFYEIAQFQREFELQHYELCLLIPVLCGNDFADRAFESPSNRLLSTLRKYNSGTDFIQSPDKPDGMTLDMLESARSQYGPLESVSAYLPGGLISNPALGSMPEWVLAKLKDGKFCSQLLAVCHGKSILMPRVVEVIEMESAWRISRNIRWRLYGFMGLSKEQEVIEIIRKDSCPRLSEEVVWPKPTNFKEPPEPVHIHSIGRMSDEMRSDLILVGLECNRILTNGDIKLIFSELSDQWKLPLAATFFWYRQLKEPNPDLVKTLDLVKALLLCFFTCSEVIEDKSIAEPNLTGQQRAIRHQSLHAFAQWQCVYFDAVALNYLTQEPFHTTSPARLYSGKVAMFYALASLSGPHWVNRFIARDSEQRRLFKELLYLVTGCDEDGEQKGAHALKPKKKKDPWTEVKK